MVGWEEALEEIAIRFGPIKTESGPEFLALCQGTGRPYTEFTGPFIHAFGSPNYVSSGHKVERARHEAGEPLPTREITARHATVERLTKERKIEND